jgi:hypothetical protein
MLRGISQRDMNIHLKLSTARAVPNAIVDGLEAQLASLLEGLNSDAHVASDYSP